MISGELADISDMPEVATVPIEDILRQHRKRFIIHTQAHGDVIMKYMTRSARIRMDALRRELYPELPYWEDELATKGPLAVLPDASPEIREQTEAVLAKLLPTVDIYALACIISPELEHVEDLHGFLDALEPDEAEAVRQILMLCTAHAPPSVDQDYLAIAERFGVSVIDPILLDNMTMQQQEVLVGILNAERQQERDLMRKMGMKP